MFNVKVNPKAFEIQIVENAVTTIKYVEILSEYLYKRSEQINFTWDELDLSMLKSQRKL